MTPAVLVAGWAYPSESLLPLAEALRPVLACHLHAWPDLHPDDGNTLYQRVAETRADVLIGWSLGGLVALEMVLRHTPPIRGLVLVASTSRFCRSPDYPAGVQPATLRAMRIGLHNDASETLRRFHHLVCAPRVPPPALTEQFIANALCQPLDALTSGLDYLSATDLRPFLESLRVPILLIHGDRDAVIPADASIYIANHAPRATLKVLSGYGHDLPLTAACSVAQTIADFLNSLRT